jgi:hypothetical protein
MEQALTSNLLLNAQLVLLERLAHRMGWSIQMVTATLDSFVHQVPGHQDLMEVILPKNLQVIYALKVLIVQRGQLLRRHVLMELIIASLEWEAQQIALIVHLDTTAPDRKTLNLLESAKLDIIVSQVHLLPNSIPLSQVTTLLLALQCKSSANLAHIAPQQQPLPALHVMQESIVLQLVWQKEHHVQLETIAHKEPLTLLRAQWELIIQARAHLALELVSHAMVEVIVDPLSWKM